MHRSSELGQPTANRAPHWVHIHTCSASIDVTEPGGPAPSRLRGSRCSRSKIKSCDRARTRGQQRSSSGPSPSGSACAYLGRLGNVRGERQGQRMRKVDNLLHREIVMLKLERRFPCQHLHMCTWKWVGLMYTTSKQRTWISCAPGTLGSPTTKSPQRLSPGRHTTLLGRKLPAGPQVPLNPQRASSRWDCGTPQWCVTN